MLIILGYHRAGVGRYSNPVPVLRSHFEFIRRKFHIVLPGEPLHPRRLNVCLVFDDGFADFLYRIYPLLEEFSIKAVLAVSTGFIIESTSLSLEERLDTPELHVDLRGCFREKAPFCTWEELQRMASGGLIHIASHSHSHVDLTRPEVDPVFEAAESKRIIEERLKCRVSTFVYPFGKVDARVHRAVRQSYDFSMRLGSALNGGWSSRRQPLCRVQADNVADISNLVRCDRLLLYWLKRVGNGVRAALGKWDRGGHTKAAFGRW